ncbi:hypothetical protein VKT23_018580 [Stygiomarasmius scandens]|uniref:Uncharacterized protein n=1 Tax=Marasmiellus scandens TaxID=2682957 RepID=A0ABR1IQG5_9AGAR
MTDYYPLQTQFPAPHWHCPNDTLTWTSAYSTSDTRSSAPPVAPPTDACNFCSMYRCKNDDKKFLQAMEEERGDYQRRLGWLWYCIDRAAPRSDKWKRLPVWRSLVDLDDIWLMWRDGDESDLPEVPESPIPWYNRLKENDWKSVNHLISRRVDLHSQGRCTLSPLPPFLKEIQKMSFEMRLAIILWKSLLACRRVKYPLNPSSLDREIPYLVPRWWGMIPDLIKKEGTLDINEHFWQEFCDGLKQRGHICHGEHPEKHMWQVWVIVQNVLHAPISIDIPFARTNCGRCLQLRKLPTGRSEFVKPHVALLWSIIQLYRGGFEPAEVFQGYFQILLSGRTVLRNSDITRNLLNPVTLGKVDKWFNNLKAEQNWEESDTSFGPPLQNIIENSQALPAMCYENLHYNEEGLDPPWTEIEATIFKIQNESPYSTTDPKEPFHPASWICAVILLTVVRYNEPRSRGVHIFTYELRYGDNILDLVAPTLEIPTNQKFQNTLKKSGHTCWLDESCHGYSMADLYSSAYSILLDTSNVPVVGCDQAGEEGPESCAVCRTNNAFHALSNSDFLDGIDITKATLKNTSEHGLSKTAEKLIHKLNYDRYHEGYYDPQPLGKMDLEGLCKALGILHDQVQHVIDKGKELNIFDEWDQTLLGYSNKWELDESELEPDNEPEPESDNEEVISNQAVSTAHGQTQDTLVQPSSEPNQNMLSYDNAPTTHATIFPINSESVPPLQSNQPSSPIHVDNQPNNPAAYHLEDLHTFEDDLNPTLESMGYQILSTPYQMNQAHISSAQLSQYNQNASFQPPPIAPPSSLRPDTLLPLNDRNSQSNLFVPETGQPGDPKGTKHPPKLRVDQKRNKIRQKFKSMFEEHKVDIGNKVPWMDLFPFLEKHGLEIPNWPKDVKLETHNGISKAPQREVEVIFKALFEREPPIRMVKKSPGINPIFENPGSGSGSAGRDKGRKRERDQDSPDGDERERSRRRT